MRGRKCSPDPTAGINPGHSTVGAQSPATALDSSGVWHHATMPRPEATVLLDEELLRRARAAAARDGKEDYEIVEAALRRYLELDVLDEVWAQNADQRLDAEAAEALAYSELRAARRGRQGRE